MRAVPARAGLTAVAHPKLLLLLSRFPYPLDKGDKLRAYHQLRYLSQHYTVAVVALTDEPVAPAAYAAVAALCAGGLHTYRLRRPEIALGLARALARGLPLQVGYFQAAGAHRLLAGVMAAFQPDQLYCQLVRMTEYVRPYCGQLPLTLDYMDVFSAGMARRATAASRWQQPVLAREARRLRTYEARVFDWFTHHTIISDQDRQLIDHPRRGAIQVVPNGIDTAYFAPPAVPAPPTAELLFCGNMGYYPNIEAAVFLAQQVLPRVQAQHPGARLLIAGTTPAPKVLALRSATVTVSGWVPDIRAAYAAARVFVAPMRSGTGLQNKLLEAMAMRLPCVTTPLAHRALGGEPGHELLVGADADGLAAHVARLLAGPAQAAALAAHGQQFVRAHYGWEAATARLANLFRAPPVTTPEPPGG